jgi:hypothetical protein
MRSQKASQTAIFQVFEGEQTSGFLFVLALLAALEDERKSLTCFLFF